jgi:hypothetical protein
MTIPSVPVTKAQFPLILLRRMADYQPLLVERARMELGYGVTEMRAVNATWQRMLRSRSSRGPLGQLGQLRSVLGRPDAVMDRKVGDAKCRSEQWRLELWPELRFEAFVGPGDMLLKEHLVRAPDSPRPKPRRLADLEPWSCVLGDVAVALGPMRRLEGSAPTRDLALVEVPGEPGSDAKTTIATEFVYGLLQVARPYERP